MTLDRAPLRTPLTLESATCDLSATRHLAALGLRPGARVECLHTTGGGGRVVAVAGSRIALGIAILRHLVVAP